MPPGARPAFRPSQHGFAYDNAWPSQPALVLRTPLGRVPVGDAAGGLCGGMVYAALDAWSASRTLPGDRPAQGDPWFGHLVRRLLDSWDVPTGVLRYYRAMLRPDVEAARRTVTDEWPRVRSSLAAGQPVPLGVVTVASRRPADLALNHQVVAYDWSPGADPGAVVLRVYDPNRGPRDDVAITFRTDAVPLEQPAFPHTLGLSRPVRAFFVSRYQASSPP